MLSKVKYLTPIFASLLAWLPLNTQAQTLAVITTQQVEIRLCPALCQIVKGHAYAQNDEINIYESKNGWSRIEKYLNIKKVKEIFGNNIPAKPSLWIKNTAIISKQTLEIEQKKQQQKLAEIKKRANVLASIQKRHEREIQEQKQAQEIQTQAKQKQETKQQQLNRINNKIARMLNEKAKVKQQIKQKAKLQIKKQQVKQREQQIKTQSEEKIAKAKQQAEIKAQVKQAEQAKNAKPILPTPSPQRIVQQITQGTRKTEFNDGIRSFYSRPKTYNTKLNDKRLKNLPTPDSENFSLSEIIALRHHALVLLQDKICSNIIDGGRSLEKKGWLYIRCSDNPNFPRKFPLYEKGAALLDEF